MTPDAFLFDALQAFLDRSHPDVRQALQAAAMTITPLGGTPVLLAVVTATAAVLTWRGRRAQAAWLVATGVLGWALMHALKLTIARARPDASGHLVEVVGASFPSGHAMMAMVVALALCLLVRGDGAWPRRVAFGVAGVVVLAVGVSRVLLGVHWPTDVIAGWALGAAWAALARTRLPA